MKLRTNAKTTSPRLGWKLFLPLVAPLIWCVAGAQASAATYTVSNTPGIADHGDPNRPGSLQYVLDQAGSTSATVVLPGDGNYRIGSLQGTARQVVVRANVNLVFQAGAVITFGNPNSTLKIFGSVQAGLQQIFDAAPGQVRFQGNDPYASPDPKRQYHRAAITEVYPQWWGAASCLDCNAAGNLQAFDAAFRAFPTRVYIPSGTYRLRGEWRLDIRTIPEIPHNDPTDPEPQYLDFEVSGAGPQSTTLIQDANSHTAQFVGIYGYYPDTEKTWQAGKLHGLKIQNPQGIGLRIQNPNIRAAELQIEGVRRGGAGIELEPNSIRCVIEDIFVFGPLTTRSPITDNPDFDPADTSWSSGFKCPGGNVGQVVISRFTAAYFDIGINLFGRDGSIYGWHILNADVGVNQIGINIRNFLDPVSRSSPVNTIDIIGTYIEMWPFDGAYGIRLDRCWTGAPADPHRCPHAVRIEGGRIDPKSPLAGPNDLPGRGARPIEINGRLHMVDVPYHGEVYGTLDMGTQIRSGVHIGQ